MQHYYYYYYIHYIKHISIILGLKHSKALTTPAKRTKSGARFIYHTKG